MSSSSLTADDSGDSARPPGDEAEATSSTRTLPLSRIVVTWVELTVVGFTGAALGGATSGPPQLVVFLTTTLVSVGVLMYNVDRLVSDRLADGPTDRDG